MKVLSLFDGISCGMLALERAGIKVDKYYASEIDKYATQISEKNYPNIIRLGDVNNWREWELGEIDLIIGGSPCQGFSFAGKQLAFDDPRSKLFFTMVDIINHYKPKYFLLENVKMKKEFQDVITGYMGVQPIEINSALVSAQNRKRLYWTNIPGVKQPQDKGILLKDILEDVVDKKYNVSEQSLATYTKNGVIKGLKEIYEKSMTLTANMYKGFGNDGTTTIRIGDIGKGGQGQRIYSIEGKSVSLSALGGGQGAKTGLYETNTIRKLTPLECERLQTMPDNYTEGVSNSQRYKMLGNGWTCDVISHIFTGLL